MELGFVGLGRMGLNMTRRLLGGGHRVVAYDRDAGPIGSARDAGASPAKSLAELVGALAPPRAVWAMIPAGSPVDEWIEAMIPLLGRGDLLIDGGNSHYKDSRRRHQRLAEAGLAYVDAGTSGGIWGLEIGYCMMLGGDGAAIARLAPALDTLAPPGGWMHVGGAGAGHYCKMIHNAIEYGMMRAYGEGFELLDASDYDFDLAAIARLWNQGGVVRSWLLELAASAFAKDPGLEKIRGYVDDSGEGRWAAQEAIDRAVPAEVLALSLMGRFRSRQADSFRDKVLAALRAEFGGHAVQETRS
ncbi:MAG TPA: decarboxylating 6-phosphogluconate dehydrogenase [Candidatus Eisenbacteria bacterium]|nr:decarboxylating 6-phosphogluconate dehydrogenase [Candidatus Eisenbacteria bacterium]